MGGKMSEKPLNIKPLSEFIKEDHGKAEEVFFRKGYVDGYGQAIEDLKQLSRKHETIGKSLSIINDHINRLNNWSMGDCKNIEFPPKLDQRFN